MQAQDRVQAKAGAKAKAKNPIGIFDSGMGGLAIARALKRYLPQEDFIFLGDTLHLPYGNLSPDIIASYGQTMVQFLAQQPVKAIVVACNTVSSVLGDWLAWYATVLQLPIVNVIDPLARQVSGYYHAGQTVGLVGTVATIRSGVYEQRIWEQGGRFALVTWALSKLASLIERQPMDMVAIERLLHSYADDPVQGWKQQPLAGMILGCTHYAWVGSQFQALLGDTVRVWDAEEATAQALVGQLQQAELLRTASSSAYAPGQWRFYLSKMQPNMLQTIHHLWQPAEIAQISLVRWQDYDKLVL